jgi:hypothetical protein
MRSTLLMLVFVASGFINSALAYSDTSAHKYPPDHMLRLNEVNSRAARDFFHRFPGISTEKWMLISDGYAAKFSEMEVRNVVYYDRSGNYMNNVRYFPENTVPAYIKELVQYEFSDYTIIAGIELMAPKEHSFHINIKNRKRVKVLKITGETIEVTVDFRNAEPVL